MKSATTGFCMAIAASIFLVGIMLTILNTRTLHMMANDAHKNVQTKQVVMEAVNDGSVSNGKSTLLGSDVVTDILEADKDIQIYLNSTCLNTAYIRITLANGNATNVDYLTYVRETSISPLTTALSLSSTYNKEIELDNNGNIKAIKYSLY